MRLALLLGLLVIVGCQSGAAENPAAPEDPAAVAHDQAIEQLRAVGGQLDVEETASGKPGIKLDFRDTPLTDDELGRMKALNPIVELYLNNSRITDAGLAHVAEMKSLQRVFLNGTSITDAGLRHLTSLPNLQAVTLQATKVTPAGVKQLQQAMPHVRVMR